MTGLILPIFRYSRIWLDLSPLPLKLNNCETISLPDFVVNNSVSRIGASYSSNPFGFSKFDEDKIAYKAILVEITKSMQCLKLIHALLIKMNMILIQIKIYLLIKYTIFCDMYKWTFRVEFVLKMAPIFAKMFEFWLGYDCVEYSKYIR